MTWGVRAVRGCVVCELAQVPPDKDHPLDKHIARALTMGMVAALKRGQVSSIAQDACPKHESMLATFLGFTATQNEIAEQVQWEWWGCKMKWMAGKDLS